ncbi:hypothetical protein [Marinospirillum insulare]|uniref:Uncharacterized protein n=1 Tax=Marinospirillum insulare TaxID=217169 RepID=A0ABQ5ZWB6_9GAMM|nr:hypothetical protein [Marinospirillum insulare]GLR63746.1 hypothetical protein GCM10007878_11810 [Marinospirillum insulare]
MLNESTKNLRQTLYKATQTFPESKCSSFDPNRFAWLVDIIEGNLAFEESQGRPVNKVDLIAALALDFEELYRSDENLLNKHRVLDSQTFALSREKTALHEQRTKAGFSSAQQRRLERNPDWSDWQGLAERLWLDNPSLSKAEAARIIAKIRKEGENPNTIRKRISKPENK